MKQSEKELVMKKIVCLLLSLCLCVGLAVPAIAAETIASGSCGDNLTWTLDNAGTLTISGTGKMTSYNVSETPPPWYEHRNDIQAVDIQSGVTEIGSEAFRDCVHLTRVVIPDGVTRIRSFVFYGCEKLESVTIPADVTQIGDMTFFACPALKDIYYAGSQAQWGQITIRNQNGALDSVNIHYNSAAPDDPEPTPGNIVDQGTCGNNLTWTLDDEGTLTISGTGEMEDFAPYSTWEDRNKNYTIRQAVIENGVTSIGRYAFEWDENLTAVKIPATVSRIGEDAFSGCPKLTMIEVDSANADFISVDSVLFNKAQTQLLCYAAGKPDTSYTVPGGVTSLASGSFYGCDSLTKVTLPDGIVSIGANAFAHCENLADLNLPNSLTVIDTGAFSRCHSLVKVAVPSRITSIDYRVFRECTSMTEIYIPVSVTSIDSAAFWDCSGLTDVYYAGSAEQWNAINVGTGIVEFNSVTIHYNSTGPEVTPAFSSPSAPTVSSGAAITRANIGTLTEITVPVTYSGSTAQTVTFAVPFFDGNGKFIGVGMTTETVTSSTQSVTMSVRGLSGSERMKVLILTENFCPLSSAGSYDIPA